MTSNNYTTTKHGNNIFHSLISRELGYSKRYVDLNFGKGECFFSITPEINCLINDGNSDIINFFKNLHNNELISEIKLLDNGWELISKLSELSTSELYITFQDYSTDIITLEDVKFIVRAIILMNIESEDFAPLINKSFIVSIDQFSNVIIKNIVNKLQKQKGIVEINTENIPSAFIKGVDAEFKRSFFDHFQNIINIQNTDLVDCISKLKESAIWYFLTNVSKDNSITYDKNGNLKNQFDGESYNSTTLKNFESDTIKKKLTQINFSNIPPNKFLVETDLKETDFILADFRFSNQFSRQLLGGKFFSSVKDSIYLLMKSNYNWISIIDDEKLLSNVTDLSLCTVETYTHNSKEIFILRPI